jgi:transcriptional regulator with GAF, ATPase, and Fis domain
VSAALREGGLRLVEDDEADRSGPGIVVFDEVTGQLHDVIAETSRGGLVRVLAVASEASVLPPSAAWSLMAAGASDVLAWDLLPDPAGEIQTRMARWRDVEDLLASPAVRDHLVGQGQAWTLLLRQIVEVARFTASSVLITGESGTGKELIARLIHELDARPGRADFVILDCTTVVPTLSGSEFFGHEKGAFTGADAARDGVFALADGGTLLLDEVGELPLPLQAEVLRVIQEGMYKRVGGNLWRRTSFRLVCATNRDLPADVAAGRFRGDLFYRIAAWTFRLPPLRDRMDDVPLLARSFLGQARAELADVELDDAVWDLLLIREYPGNVRDLRQLAFRIAQRHVGRGRITVGDVPPDERPALAPASESRIDPTFEEAIRRALARGATLRAISRDAADTAIRIALADEASNVQRAARRLGVTDRAIQLRRASPRRPRSGHQRTS